MRRLLTLFLLALLAGAAPVAAGTPVPPAVIPIRAYADTRGLSVYWTAHPDQVLACAERRKAWPPLADTPVGCVETRGGAMHVPIRDLNLRMDDGGDTLLILYDQHMQVLSRGQERTRPRYQTWFPWVPNGDDRLGAGTGHSEAPVPGR